MISRYFIVIISCRCYYCYKYFCSSNYYLGHYHHFHHTHHHYCHHYLGRHNSNATRHTRTLPLLPGKEYSVDVFSDAEVYSLAIHVGDKIETVSVPAGKFNCIRVEPTIRGDAIFKAREGRMTIWLTNDERRMPVLIRSRVAVGSFDAELVKFSN